MTNQSQDPHTRRTAKAALHGAVYSTLAALLWVATTLQAVASTAIVTASYISAWIMRAQHRVLVFFTRYAGSVHEETPAPTASEGLTDEELEASQRGDDVVDAEVVVERKPPPTQGVSSASEYSNLFGGKTPKGQA